MTDTVLIEASITDAENSFIKVNNLFEELESVMSDIDSLLSDGKWAGDKHDQCVDLHAIIKVYASSIKPLNSQHKSDVVELTELGDGFSDASVKVQGLNW